ncbi:hypothetical protein G0Q06_03525 [Puniceicoccales bacterium CK1056]|uniref:Transmembrane protein (PGPGW) n=1 Tax=Oceanipulchritudo coccoides TaxID=2706888 RepID=A0A6B2M011_9BACT|nr:PGPGW domain-containing protein [Oceanipulchritudo coccoides]NDV61514.1 hypothetical protein [Oceanipulchritudo coccoides]
MGILDWIKANEVLLSLLGAASLLMFLGSLLMIPIIVAYIPEDYFLRLKQNKFPRKPLRQIGHILKNLMGGILLLAGICMLLLPGQGILTMLVGISLLDFPGKARLQIRLVRLRRVRKSIAWIRHKAGRKPLILPDSD